MRDEMALIDTPNRKENSSPSYARIESHYAPIKQGPATNTLTKISLTKHTKKGGKGLTTNEVDVYGNLALTKGNLTISIANFHDLASGLSQTTHMLFDALMIAYAQSNGKDTNIRLPLKDYMRLRGLRDIKETRRQVNGDLEILYNITLSWRERNEDYHDMRICQAKGIKRGIITVELGNNFLKILQQYPIMLYHVSILTQNPNKNPNSYYFLKKIAAHRNMNKNKTNQKIIAVATLIESSPELARYDDIKDRGEITRRILAPFARDMNALRETLTWQFWHSKGGAVTDDEIKSMTYDIFITYMVKVEWLNYPQTHKKEEKQQ